VRTFLEALDLRGLEDIKVSTVISNLAHTTSRIKPPLHRGRADV
jgi:hypothetical protein